METERIAPGKLVFLTYSIRDECDRILEQSDLPVSYIHGGQVELLGGMDRYLEGCGVGDEIERSLTAEAGFGTYDPSLTFTDDLNNVPLEFRFVGAEVPMESESGEVRTFIVTRIEKGRLTIDGNHPLAGKALRVRIKIIEVREPTAAEIAEQDPGSIPSVRTH